jgi:mannose-6-phosphate isomerase-like protein (cupin superfamily)
MTRVSVGYVGFLVALASIHCNRENVGVVSGPPLTIARGSPHVSDTVHAHFVTLRQPGERVPILPCSEVIVAAVIGPVNVLGETLAEGDTLWAKGVADVELAGRGSALLARIEANACGDAPERAVRVVRAGASPDIVWANGAMRARFQVEPPLSHRVYAGRLEGTAKVAPHAHQGSWEIVATREAAGTFVLAGVEQRLTAGSVVVVPPGVTHAFTPDPGSRLQAVQLYVPPGPEQRFRTLAHAESATAPSGPVMPGGAGPGSAPADSGVR